MANTARNTPAPNKARPAARKTAKLAAAKAAPEPAHAHAHAHAPKVRQSTKVPSARAVVKTVAKGDNVALIGFGTFKSSKRAARVGRNPATGKELKIAATTVPRFTAGAGFKAAVAGKKAAKKK